MFLENLKSLFSEEKAKKLSFEKFLSLGLPDKTWENYQYVPLNDLYQERFPHALNGDCQSIKDNFLRAFEKNILDNTLVFVNGIFQKELSLLDDLPSSMMILPLSEAEDKFSSFLDGKVDDKDPFSLLNHAFYKEGVFIYLPPKTIVESPLQILHIYTERAHFSPRIHLFLGKESELNLYIIEKSQVDSGWINGGLDIHMEEASSLKLYTLFENQKNMFHTESIKAELKKRSSLKLLSRGFGKKLWRQNFRVTLAKEALADLSGAFHLDQKNEAHVNTFVCHAEENSTSFQKFKGVLNGQSRMSFEGKIFVEKRALKSEAYQLNNNLILDEKARVYCKPNLEIFADDVKASHGATIGKLNQEDIFYLTAKGLPQPIARQLLIEGFTKDILNQIPVKVNG